jgi:hypothetical protein
MKRLFWQFVGTLLLVGLVLHFTSWIVGAAVVVGALWFLAMRVWRASAAAAARAAICGRADEQHRWVLADDDRGVYGDYPPAKF